MKTSLLAIVLLTFLLFSCETKVTTSVGSDAENTETKTAPEVTYHASHEPKKANAPFSDAVQVGDLYFLSGQIGMDQTTRTLVEGGIEAETKQTLENIKAVLAQHGMDMSDVVKSLVVLDDINDFAAFNDIYKTYLPQKPARTTFAAEALAAGAKIEFEVIAVKQ